MTLGYTFWQEMACLGGKNDCSIEHFLRAQLAI